MKFKFVKRLACGLLVGALMLGGSSFSSIEVEAAEIELTTEDEAEIQKALQELREAGVSGENLQRIEKDLRKSLIEQKKAETGYTGFGGADNTVVNPEVTDSNPNAVVVAPTTVTFDAEYYAQMNPDVVAVFGTGYDALYHHYVTYGKAEGRKACAADLQQPANNLSDETMFDAEFYFQAYPDVAAAFGMDKDALYNHYVTHGKAEGRIASAADVQLFE